MSSLPPPATGHTSSSSESRIVWIDSLRGVGISLVVVGHAVVNPTVHHYIFLFHMPLFIALSGYVFTRSDPRVLVLRRVLSLLVPYLAYLVAVTGVDWMLCALDGRMPSLPAFPIQWFLLRAVYGGSLLHDALGALWFLTCLFMANVAYAFAAWRLGHARKKGMILLAIGSLAIGYILPPLRAPLAVSQVPLAFFFFWIGALYRELPAEPRWTWILVAVISVPCILLAPDFDLKYMVRGVIWLNVPAAIGGSYLLVCVVRMLERVPGWVRWTSEIGQAALVILGVHLLVKAHLSGLAPQWLVAMLGIAIPYLIYRAATRSSLARTLFLGKGSPSVALARLVGPRLPAGGS